MSRPAAGGGRWVDVDPERLDRWLDGFAERHHGLVEPPDVTPATVRLRAADGAVATCSVPFPPLVPDPRLPYDGLLAHAVRSRRLGLLLVRRGGYGVGVAEGRALVASKVGQRHVQGRSAAGGWSQQRFARRREGQTREAVRAAADLAARLLLTEPLDALVTGGDRTLLGDVLADPRLAALRPLVSARVLDVPDPRLAVLRDAVAAARAVEVLVHDTRRDPPRPR